MRNDKNNCVMKKCNWKTLIWERFYMRLNNNNKHTLFSPLRVNVKVIHSMRARFTSKELDVCNFFFVSRKNPEKFLKRLSMKHKSWRAKAKIYSGRRTGLKLDLQEAFWMTNFTYYFNKQQYNHKVLKKARQQRNQTSTAII